jgi:hypothetical protein
MEIILKWEGEGYEKIVFKALYQKILTPCEKYAVNCIQMTTYGIEN